MKHNFLVFIALCFAASLSAQTFEAHFDNRTLRLDYIFAGNAERQEIFVDELHVLPQWYGRRHRLNEVPLRGNGSITVREQATGAVIYRHSFSSLFQEWLATAEAKRTRKSFENVFLVPYPKHPVEITVELRDYHDSICAAMTHTVNPNDILISRQGERNITPYTTLQQADDTTHCIHIAFLAEGYKAEQMDTFITDCRAAMASLFNHEPFKAMRGRFNIVAVMAPSMEAGVSEPNKGIWLNTALGAHFDTFYSERYLTTLHLKQMHDWLAGTPYEHIIVLANGTRYGGGGIYNSYTLSNAHARYFLPVVVHEFGHSFGGLGDEYPYGDDDPMYFADTEPWEPNLTTRHRFEGKWENLIAEGKAGMVEGGGYLSHGVWRGVADCRMRTNETTEFCVVCQQALRRLIDFYTR
ncbi:MAG: peptidase M64 [Prevotella sp.]|nr:peptidase M64 [Prevotella sp.]